MADIWSQRGIVLVRKTSGKPNLNQGDDDYNDDDDDQDGNNSERTTEWRMERDCSVRPSPSPSSRSIHGMSVRQQSIYIPLLNSVYSISARESCTLFLSAPWSPYRPPHPFHLSIHLATFRSSNLCTAASNPRGIVDLPQPTNRIEIMPVWFRWWPTPINSWLADRLDWGVGVGVKGKGKKRKKKYFKDRFGFWT